jgi:hypothetical protein
MAGKNKKGVKGFQSVEEGGVHTGTEAWNIAQYFTGYSIAIPLRDLNDLEDIARFGAVKIDDDLMMNDDEFAKRRADAVKRYWQKLRQIVADTLFKIKVGDRKKATLIHEWLKKIPKYFDGLLYLETNTVSHEDFIKVNEAFLTTLLNKLVERKEKYLSILDHAGLIFREVDEVDLDKMTSEFVHGG